mgnify:CR=1 FL=1
MTSSLATMAYIGATILFILSLGGLSNPETARRGNLFGMVGMTIAVLATVLGPRVKAVLSRLYGRKPTALDAPDVPLDILGTAFQWKVWKALTEIPAGQTRTYGEIARRIGEPKAARAVGRACATNHAAVVIPCHRAVGASGAQTGYRWGVARKERLLAEERRRSSR